MDPVKSATGRWGRELKVEATHANNRQSQESARIRCSRQSLDRWKLLKKTSFSPRREASASPLQ